MTAQSYVVVDQSDVSPCVLGVVDTTPKDIANIIYSDIISEFPNITQQYTVSHVNVGPDCMPIEEFEEQGKKFLESFLREFFTFGTFSFIFQFYDCDVKCEDIEYRYTIQDVKAS